MSKNKKELPLCGTQLGIDVLYGRPTQYRAEGPHHFYRGDRVEREGCRGYVQDNNALAAHIVWENGQEELVEQGEPTIYKWGSQ